LGDAKIKECTAMKVDVNTRRVTQSHLLETYFRSLQEGTELTLSFQDPWAQHFGGQEVRGLWTKREDTKFHFEEGTNFMELFQPETETEVYPDEMIRPFIAYENFCAIYQGRMLGDFEWAPLRENYVLYPEYQFPGNFKYISSKPQGPCPF
jgi:hypothetical protein